MAHEIKHLSKQIESIYTEIPAAYIDLLDQHLSTALQQLQSEKIPSTVTEDLSICQKILEIFKENFHASP